MSELLLGIGFRVLVFFLLFGRRLDRAHLLVDVARFRCSLNSAKTGLNSHQAEEPDLGGMIYMLGHEICWFHWSVTLDNPILLSRTASCSQRLWVFKCLSLPKPIRWDTHGLRSLL